MEPMNPVEPDQQEYLNTVLEYAEILYSVEQAVISGAKEEKIKEDVKAQLANTTHLKGFGELVSRFDPMIPRFIERKKLIDKYLAMANDQNAIKILVEERLNARLQPGKPQVQVDHVYGLATVKGSEFSLGVMIDFKSMENTAASFNEVKFYGVHIGEGLVLLTVNDEEVENGRVKREAAARLSDTMHHENYHSLAQIIGAHSIGSKINLQNSEKKIYGEGRPVGFKDIAGLIYDMKRVAKNEIIPEAEMDLRAYQSYSPGTEDSLKGNMKAAYNFIAHNLRRLVVPHTTRLGAALENLPPGWDISDKWKTAFEEQMANIEDLMYGSLSSFFIARLKLKSQEKLRLLFYSASVLQLEDFRLLPTIADLINSRKVN